MNWRQMAEDALIAALIGGGMIMIFIGVRMLLGIPL